MEIALIGVVVWLACGFAGFWIDRRFLLKRIVRGADELLVAVVILGGPVGLAIVMMMRSR